MNLLLPQFRHMGAAVGALAGVVGGPPPENHTDGLLAQWLFSEGSGTTVADSLGVHEIDLTAPSNPNYTWTPRGVTLAGGVVETPSITGARTVALLYKTGLNETGGFLISGGNSSGNGFLQQGGGYSYPIIIAGGYGPHTLAQFANNSAFESNRGGYVLIFQEFNTAYNTKLGLGGRHSSSNNRCANCELVAAAVWDKVLTDANRLQAYEFFAYVAKQRGVYLKASDAPTQRRGIFLLGESVADGRSEIANLSAGDQAQVFTKTFIMSGNNTGSDMSAIAQFDLGVNQQITLPATEFGPELGFAQAIEGRSEDAVIIKLAKGGTRLDGANTVASSSWNVDEGENTGLFYMFLRHFQRAEQEARNNGIGLDIEGTQLLVGLNDAASTLYSGASPSVYQGYLQDLYDAIHTYTGLSGLKMHVGRAHNSDPSSDATALARIRTAQADFVTSLGSLGELYDMDGLTFFDNVHPDAASSLLIGAAGDSFLLA